jgi:lysophospholipase L1-like esterase
MSASFKKNSAAVFYAAILLFVSLSNAFSQAVQAKLNLNIVFIGNSITYGANLSDPQSQAPPVTACQFLQQQPGIGKVAFANQGHSGFTTIDFLPKTGKPFADVEEAAVDFSDPKALLIFSIKLGTNDSAMQGPNGAPVSPQEYETNLKVIIDSLLKEFPASLIVLQRPIWYSPNTYNGAKYLQEGLARLQSYFPKLNELVKQYAISRPNRVFAGDEDAFVYFKKHFLTDLTPEQGHQGTFYLHPNQQGAAALGNFWGKAIYKVVSKRM